MSTFRQFETADASVASLVYIDLLELENSETVYCICRLAFSNLFLPPNEEQKLTLCEVYRAFRDGVVKSRLRQVKNKTACLYLLSKPVEEKNLSG